MWCQYLREPAVIKAAREMFKREFGVEYSRELEDDWASQRFADANYHSYKCYCAQLFEKGELK